MEPKRMLVFALAAVLLAGCAPGANTVVGTPGAAGEIAGFWLGLWHGMICRFTFVVSLFSEHVGVYEVHNTGGWYNFGFLLGASSALGARWRRRGGQPPAMAASGEPLAMGY